LDPAHGQKSPSPGWLTKLIWRELKFPSYLADRDADWLILNFGWKVVDKRIARMPASAIADKGKKKSGIMPRHPKMKT